MPDTPRTIEEYLEQLRHELAGSDPALVQDVLGEAEEYLRSEVARLPEDRREAGLAGIVERYGTPSEIAEANRQTERTVQAALNPPPPPRPKDAPRRTPVEGFLGVFVDPLAYTSFFYMLLSLLTGIVYFTWVVTGLSLSLGFLVLIIGIPFFVLFVATVRVLSFGEGRIVESLLGERMPRRPPTTDTGGPILERVKRMLADGRTWSTMIYMALKLPLGILYFTVFITLIAVSFGFLFYPVINWFFPQPILVTPNWVVVIPVWGYPLVSLLGFLGVVVTLHLARWAGMVHAAFAKGMLVQT
jgi:hypothetical protein